MEQLGRYTILGELGRGAMGVVYKASDPLLNRTVAVKTIHMTADPQERTEYEARFYQEAKAAGGLSHPNIVTIYDIGHAGDLVYMAMELIEGEELRDLLDTRSLDTATALDIAAQVADGLSFAHSRGVVHRDIKPANIMVQRGGAAKIMDFGIARMRASDVKTQTGLLLGSPKYMAPEQLLGHRADHRCDLFSVGVVLYEMLVGAPPFAGDDITQLMYQIVHSTPPAPSAANAALPPMLDLIVARALAKDLDARYGDARELAADLRACRARLVGAGRPPAPKGNEHRTTIPPSRSAAAGAADATQTLPLGSPRSEPRLRLRISRRFDSIEAVRRLAALTGNEPAVDAFARTIKLDLAAVATPAAAGREDERSARRERSARETLVVVAGVIIAAAIAVFIALA
jgi:serine/threonine protein kinase